CGSLRFDHVFPVEQEYSVAIGLANSADVRQIAELRLFALDDDLLGRRPFKGDLHLHSNRSDGVESPAYVVGASRRIGLDFTTVTDHFQYDPSLEAMRAFGSIDTDLRIYPGEEVHPPGNSTHMINFGGRFSINALFDSGAYREEVDALGDRLTGFPDWADRYPYASCLWCCDKIREAGGLAVLCHPSWVYRGRYDVPQYLVDLLFEHQPFDALELVGGYHPFELESNALQIARYHDERAQGRRIPIVGASDSHGCEEGELFGWYYTVVFAPSLELSDLIESVKDLYSVAVEDLPGQPPRAFGPFRLVRYAQYLLREVFPLHDELCVEEGRLMLAYLAGDTQAAEALRLLCGRTAALYDHLWSGG
ncbi:MAG: hypothetical protein MUQ10_13405, partial [Anaerolineae bacterium]|nr:hypothetical protein [Anaerolineae bacterium]